MTRAKIILFLGLFMAFGPLLAMKAYAEPKPRYAGWWYADPNMLSVMPQKTGAPHFHAQQWKPQETSLNKKQREKIIERLKSHKVITNLTSTPHMAIVKSGPYFTDLAYPDQQYIMRIIALHYDILNSDYGMFVIKDHQSDDMIGTYTKYGLQMY